MSDDLDLRDAFRAVREGFDGEHPEPDVTLNRALFRARALDRKRRVARWVFLPAAAALVASTAWAGVTGRLAPAVRSVVESLHSERVSEPPAPAPIAAPPAPTPAVAEEPPPVATAEPEAEPEPAPAAPPPSAPAPAPARTLAAAPAAASAAPFAAASAPAPAPAPVPTTTASTPDPNAALFAEAHRLHFTDKDPARALAAWDRYLAAAPNGRFAPEARYNRALALVRLGRHAEAKRELEAFANGTYGEYRREDARALLTALARE